MIHCSMDQTKVDSKQGLCLQLISRPWVQRTRYQNSVIVVNHAYDSVTALIFNILSHVKLKQFFLINLSIKS